MSARSRERWRRFAYIGQLRMAYQILLLVSEAKHLSSETRKRAADGASQIASIMLRVSNETGEPLELSAKKGT